MRKPGNINNLYTDFAPSATCPIGVLFDADPKVLQGSTSTTLSTLTIPNRLTAVPKGASDDVILEAYRASKRLEYEIRTKWDGLQVDLTSGYPPSIITRPIPPRIVDRSFEVVVPVLA